MLPYYEDEHGNAIYHGDSLEIIGWLVESGRLVDLKALIMDPPYASGARMEAAKSSSGAMVRGLRWASKPINNDQMTTTGFVWLIRHVLLGLAPAMPEGSSVLSFIDWRQWPNLVGAIESCNLRVNQMVVWDKSSMGMGNGFRAQHELICHASQGTVDVGDKNVPNVLRYPRDRESPHPSPKPVGLMVDLVRCTTDYGELVIDPFGGGGSTAVAAKQIGRRCILIENDEEHCETSARRLLQTMVMESPPDAPRQEVLL